MGIQVNTLATKAPVAPERSNTQQPLLSGLDALFVKGWRFQPVGLETGAAAYRSGPELVARLQAGEAVQIFCPGSDHAWPADDVAALREFVFAETDQLEQLPDATRVHLDALSKLRGKGYRFYSAPKNRFAVRPRIVPVWLLRKDSLYIGRDGEPRQKMADPNRPQSRAVNLMTSTPTQVQRATTMPRALPAQRPAPAQYAQPARRKARRSWKTALFGTAAACIVVLPLLHFCSDHGSPHPQPAPVVDVRPPDPPPPPAPVPPVASTDQSVANEVIDVPPVVVRHSDREDFKDVLEGWGQTNAGNCASVGVIKAAMATYGTNVFDEFTKDDAGTLHVRLWDGVRIDVTTDEFRIAASASHFKSYGDEKGMRWAQFMFAVEAKHHAMRNGWSIQQALDSLDNGSSEPAVARLLGLEGLMNKIDVADVPKTHLAIASSPFHAVFVEDGKIDHYGKAIPYDGLAHEESVCEDDKTKVCSWEISEAYALGGTADTTKFPTYTGLYTISATDDQLANAPAKSGARVYRVIDGSPADKAGLKADDVILSVDGRTLERDGVERLVSKHRVGDAIPMKVWRNAQTIAISVEAAEHPPN